MVQGSITALNIAVYNLLSLGSTVDLARWRANVHFFLPFFSFFFVTPYRPAIMRRHLAPPRINFYLYTARVPTTLEIEANAEIREMPEPWDGKDLFLLVVTGVGIASLAVWSLNLWDGIQRDKHIKALQKIWRERNEARKREKENDEKKCSER